MSNTVTRLAALSPERRKLFEQRVRGSASPIIPRRSPGDRLLLSFAQQRLWFLDQLVPGNPFYNIAGPIRMNFSLNVDVFRRSLNEIVRRHESLRTTFSVEDGVPVQVISPQLLLELPIIDLRAFPPDRREEEASKLASAEARTPFDLSKGPLIRAKLLQLDTQDFLFLLTIHHIVSDGWSTGIFFQELNVLYACFATGQPVPLRELPIQYADFALWQRGWIKGEVLEKQLSYWRERLTGIPTLDLPTDHSRPSIPSFRGDNCPIAVPLEVMQRLKDLSGECEATLFMTLIAAFHALLHRYSGQDVIAVGSPVANRNRPDIEGLIGFFVNSLVLRADFEGNPAFRSLLAQVRETAIGAYANQDLPFEMLVEQLQPERDLSRNPLFQVIFQLMNAPTMGAQPSASSAPAVNLQVGTSKFDLNITMLETAEGLVGSFEFNTDLFDVSTIARMVAHYQTLLESVAANPLRSISELTILTPAERRQILVDWNATEAAYPSERSLAELFEEQVVKQPQSIAVSFGKRELNYAELNTRANQIAWHLRSLGIGRGSHVGICVERSPEMIVGTVAVVKSGGAYVPLDPAYPQDRLAFMIADAQLQVVITQQHLLDRFSQTAIPVICLDRDASLHATFGPENPEAVNQAEDLAYVMYTSGSTGTPKGVCIPHRAIGRLVLNSDFVRLGPGDRIAQVSNFSFDAATFEIWGALLNGGQLVGFEKEVLLSAFDFAAELERCPISAMFLTTALFNQLAREDPAMFRTVQTLMVGGEALDPKWVRRVLESEPPSRLMNGYGPTEATTFAVCHLIQSVPQGVASVPIGRPIANTVVYILDKYGQPVPVGVRGELHIGGPGVARGYWKRPELTAQRFISNPFREDEDQMLYKTGDLVRYLPDGCIDFVSRVDNQVKLRGFRIELGEIEATLAQHPAVKDVVAVIREDSPGSRRLIAYVVQNTLSAAANGHGTSGPLDVHAAQWQKAYDEIIYTGMEDQASTHQGMPLNLTGWVSSYTKQPIPAEVMKEQVDHTVERVLALRPRRILEIGCGAGLLLFRIAPHCDQYVGTDFSAVALQYVQREMKRLPQDFSNVRLLERTADDFSGLEDGAFDVVLLNSVIQYFPSAGYLAEVLRKAVRAVGSRGSIFLGDVRSLPLREAFHLAVALHNAPDDLTGTQILAKLSQSVAEEQEMLIGPAFFRALQQELPAITGVEIRPKRGRNCNELTQFRYDVVLRIGRPPEKLNVEWKDWTSKLVLEDVGHALENGANGANGENGASGAKLVGYRGVPNARVAGQAAAVAELDRHASALTASQLREYMKLVESRAFDPEAFWDLARERDFDVDVRWDDLNQEGRFDVVLSRRNGSPASEFINVDVPAGPPPHSWEHYTNNPAQGVFAQKLTPELRKFLQDRLPEYMMPQAFVLLDKLPLTPNGKTDKKALPTPGQGRPDSATTYVAPRTPVEEKLAAIWCEVLTLAKVGVHDNFFTQLGGHSLTATQLFSRIRKVFEIELPIRKLFEGPTIAQLAECVEEYCSRPKAAIVPAINPIQPATYELDADINLDVDVDKLSDAEVEALLEKLQREESSQ